MVLVRPVGRDAGAKQGVALQVEHLEAVRLRHPHIAGQHRRVLSSVGARRQVRTAQSLTHTVQQRTETGLAVRIMRLSTWMASATSPS